MLKCALAALLFLSFSIRCFPQPGGPPEPAKADPLTVPAGTVLQIRLRQTVSSFGSRRGTEVKALLIAPVEMNGRILLPMNSELHGSLARIRRVGMGFVRETAMLHFQFDTILFPDGHSQSLQGEVSGVDDSRETVDEHGRIRGIRATASLSSVLSGLAMTGAGMDPMLLLFGMSSSLSVFRIPESEIILPAGAELHFRLTAPLVVANAIVPSDPRTIESAEDKETLFALVQHMPFRTATIQTNIPSDITSVLYAGSEASLAKAFDAAGWKRVDDLSPQSRYKAMRAVIENQGYREAPMSTLLLNGALPTFTYAKTLDTFFKRHHLRVYRAQGFFHNLPLWTSTATHDSGIAFSKKGKTLIHLIDQNIDEERSKVVNDLVLTGCVDAIGYLERPWVPQDLMNATGDTLLTDRRIAVLLLNACDSPLRAEEPDRALAQPKTTAPVPNRALRDTTLTIFNDFYRGNVFYQGYTGVRLGQAALRRHKSDAGQSRTIHFAGEEFGVVPGAVARGIPGGPDDPGAQDGSFHLPGERRSLATILDFSISGGYSAFGNSRFSTQPIAFNTIAPAERIDMLGITQLHTGYSIAPKITLHSWKYVSHELGFTYNNAAFSITGVSTVAEGADYEKYGGQIRQFTYNTLVYFKPNGSRVRPYVAVGPAIQLLRLTDSKLKGRRALKFTTRDLNLLVGAYEFGSAPPLEGGGVFQLGVQYGAGVKVQLSPHFFVRSDFRETLSPQPDYWTKSYPTLRSFADENTQVEIGPLQKFGPLHQRAFTTGFGVSF